MTKKLKITILAKQEKRKPRVQGVCGSKRYFPFPDEEKTSENSKKTE